MFLLLFHCFLITQTEIELQPNINLIKINKKTENSQRVLNKRRERTLRIRMDHVVKVDETKRETDRQTVGCSGKQRIEEKLWRV